MRLPIVLGLLALSVSCGKKSDDKDTTAQDTVESVITALNQAYPGALSISVFPKDNVATTTLKLADDTTTAPENLKAKSAEADKLLKGKADNCLPPVFLRMPKPDAETCYEFDQEMLVGTKANPNGGGGGGTQSYGTADGKSKVTGSTEACLVSFARSKIKEVEAILDQGLGMQQGMICQAVKDEVDVSGAATEEGVDLKDTLKSALAGGAPNALKPVFTVKEATMEKDSNGVYRVNITLSMVKPDGKTVEQNYQLSHVPDSEDNSTYHGVISITRNEPMTGDTSGMKRYLSLSYTRTSESGASRLQAELRTANFASSLQPKALNTDGTVNFNAASETESNQVISGIMQVAFDKNTDDDTGTFEYWQNPGGNYNESARGMVFKLTKNASSGVLEGCGMSGAAKGLSIRKALKDGTSIKPDSSYHPFFWVKENNNPRTGTGITASCSPSSGTGTCTVSENSTKLASWTVPTFSVAANVTAAEEWAKSQTSVYITRQCVKQNATSGVYEIDTGLITDTVGYELFQASTKPEFVIGKPNKPKDPPPPPKS